MTKRTTCTRCHGYGLYADPRCEVDGRRMAVGKKSKERTIACPVCGVSANPVK